MNPNLWPELVSLRARLALRSQTPTHEWPLYVEESDAILVVREWPDGSLTAYTVPMSDLQSRTDSDHDGQ